MTEKKQEKPVHFYISLLASDKGKYKDRYIEFEKRGLLFDEKTEPIVSVLCENDIRKEKKQWIHLPYKDVTMGHKRISEFLGWVESGVPNADWFVFLDDDSFTDLVGLKQILSRVNPKENAVAYMQNPAQRCCNAKPAFDSMGVHFPGWFYHEAEFLILSKKTVDVLVANKQVVDFAKILHNGEPNAGDQNYGPMLYLAGINPSMFLYSVHAPEWQKLKCITGGHLVHIHGMAPDINPENYKIYSRVLQTVDEKMPAFV